MFPDLVTFITQIEFQPTTFISFLLIGYLILDLFEKEKRKFGDKLIIGIILSLGISGVLIILLWISSILYFKLTITEILWYTGIIEWIFIGFITLIFLYKGIRGKRFRKRI